MASGVPDPLGVGDSVLLALGSARRSWREAQSLVEVAKTYCCGFAYVGLRASDQD